MKVKIGGALTLPYSALDHSNAHGEYVSEDLLTLVPLTNNFGLPQANLFIQSNLSDGIYLNFELYLASRHHNETWVKGGFLQLEKLPFLPWDFVDDIMEVTTIKVGQFDVNYGDAHFRRSDGGLTFYNPFMENHIMDEFATEIGAEVDVHLADFTVVGAITNGQLNPALQKIDTTQAANMYSNGKMNPALIGKLAYDKQINDRLRLRVSGSGYYTAGSYRNTLFSGDRTGSNYYGVMYHKQRLNGFQYTLGASFFAQTDLNSTSDKFSYTYTKSTIGVEALRDTLVYRKGADEKITIPLGVGVGFSFGKTDKWLVGGDFAYKQWEKFNYSASPEALVNNSQFALGGYFNPSSSTVSNYFNKISYRAGLKYSNGFLELRNQRIEEFGISFGVGLPLPRTSSTINLAVELGSRGTKKENLIQENFVKFTLGVSIFERWFVIRKYE